MNEIAKIQQNPREAKVGYLKILVNLSNKINQEIKRRGAHSSAWNDERALSRKPRPQDDRVNTLCCGLKTQMKDEVNEF